jgi:pimeloyl-ACP methyl ester carboxylesterase
MPYVQAGSHSLHYSDSHPLGAPTPSGQTIIFVHGLGSSQNYYFPILPHLTQEHRCITIDTYGAARSQYTHDTISIPSIGEDVIGVLDALKVDQAVVVGHSMGGLVVIELAARYPDRVLGVVPIGPTHPSEMLSSAMENRVETVRNCMFTALETLSRQ